MNLIFLLGGLGGLWGLAMLSYRIHPEPIDWSTDPTNGWVSPAERKELDDRNIAQAPDMPNPYLQQIEYGSKSILTMNKPSRIPPMVMIRDGNKDLDVDNPEDQKVAIELFVERFRGGNLQKNEAIKQAFGYSKNGRKGSKYDHASQLFDQTLAMYKQEHKPPTLPVLTRLQP